jgi:hypothetical protein
MPQQFRTNAARQIVEQAGSDAVELVAELAEPLAEYILDDYQREDWQDSPHVETLAHVAALLEAQGREIPLSILDVLRRASEAGRPVGVA